MVVKKKIFSQTKLRLKFYILEIFKMELFFKIYDILLK